MEDTATGTHKEIKIARRTGKDAKQMSAVDVCSTQAVQRADEDTPKLSNGPHADALRIIGRL